MAVQITFCEGVDALDAQAWDALTEGSPILRHAFLSAMERSGSVGHGTGWQPYPMVVFQDNQLVGAMPLYLKSHSYGEYVFDWSWAEAYAQHQQSYYPKLLCAIPFTPITGARLLTNATEVATLMLEALVQQMKQHRLSSAHVLFPDEASAEALKSAGWMQRQGVQFRWENAQFKRFEDFLSQLSHDKRKKIHQERKKVAAAGVTCEYLLGEQITEADWDFFYQCYENTYLQHRSTPYLTRAFFIEIGRTMPENILLVLAKQAGEPVAAAFNLFNQETMYGRYWGATRFISGLHFELCYYQAQMFCIEHGIRYFEGGAQGEHKLARGFTPRATCSFHQIAHPNFKEAIARFLRQEANHVAVYHDELEQRVPFKAT